MHQFLKRCKPATNQDTAKIGLGFQSAGYLDDLFPISFPDSEVAPDEKTNNTISFFVFFASADSNDKDANGGGGWEC